ncbi:MAG: sugar-binding protein [Pirellulaceae bacterium]|nr:sugar-binding protein [Pirellulaceae bacterium]
MRLLKACATVALLLQLAGTSSAQLGDGECTISLDASVFNVDDIGLLEDPEFAVAAPFMSASPIADGVITEGEYANQCFFTYADNENPGHSWPNLDNLNDGDPDLTTMIHFAHTEDSLFVAFDVTDDFLDLEPGASFRNDGVEIFINADLDSGDPWGPGKFQIYVDAFDGDEDPEFNNRGSTAGISVLTEPGPEEGEFYSAGIPNENELGYVVEIEIPLASLDTAGGDEGEPIPAATGDYIMINTAIDDNDEDDNLAGQTGHHLMWHADGAGSPFGCGETCWNVPLLLSDEVTGVEGDYDGDGAITAADLDVQSQYMADNDPKGDLDGNGVTNLDDRIAWTVQIQNSYIGDSNFDGEFNSGDFVAVFSAAKYETGGAAGYAQGDWNGDLVFDSGDFVTAFSAGGYEQGPRAAAAAVPEPATATLMCLGLIALLGLRKRS